MDFRDTVQLPKTDFPMRASLAEREPQQLEAWAKAGLYEQIQQANAGGDKFVLHDGPPYANGALHEGHFLNKILKDMVVKFRAQSGRLADFVPGWDCHGLPIERQVDKQLGAKKRELTPGQFRRACRKYAEEQVEVQRAGFKRLGVFGRWDKPYLTMAFEYEAQIVRELAKIAEQGVLYRRKRPVHWCFTDATALAEAEVEYAEKSSPSIYVAFDVSGPGKLPSALADRKLALAIWTTTPWTIPANLAIAANPEIEYLAYQLGDRAVIVARDLLQSFLRECAPGELSEDPVKKVMEAPSHAVRLPVLKDHTKILASFTGRELEGVTYRHPLLGRISPVLLGEHPTTEAGTGLVHTAPGHGEDDYRMGLKYGLEILTPVNGYGKFTAEAGLPAIAGKKVFDANPQIVELLRGAGALLGAIDIRHSYPHCWRCKNPIIFRATDQWWIGLDIELPGGGGTIRKNALAAIDQIEAQGGWIPAWGKERIRGMVENRPDWCVSRQRQWGVPIPVAYCAKDREALVSPEFMERVAKFFDSEGADAWFDRPLSELLPPGARCAKCGGAEFEKETDILDVWFDSGSSFAAVLGGRWPTLRAPADLYLEGSDQHRGWFNSSLTIGVATRGAPPFKACLTHGFVVDGEGRKMSKSLGNSLDPAGMIKKYGAEVVRLWVAASDYRDDIRLSNNILDTLSEGYRKIRNTLRYCLSQLFDFDPDADSIPLEGLLPVDRWALSRLERYRAQVVKAYESYEFHRVYHATVDLCATDLSAFYFDALKDRTYCSGKRWPERRAAQTVLYRIARDLCRLLAPMSSFTAEEAWQHLPRKSAPSVFLAGLPAADASLVDEALEEEFRELAALRLLVNGALEQKRVAKEIGKATEADVIVRLPGDASPALREVVEKYEHQLADLFLCASVTVAEGVKLAAEVQKSPNAPCDRCWRALPEVASSAQRLCARCAKAVAQ